MAIQSFADRATEDFFLRGSISKRAGWAGAEATARRKLDMLHYASGVKDLSSPPGNRLEALKGDLKGLHSIRINDRWRIIFRWTKVGPEQVRIVDYH
ncbi:MAG: type II toxin-antitoxin system RelE/ParE family toxin [Planctomycetes bacterium]|nr:type II toxin-antitoxin system RelE/ParE family toxin [Planctomycetota bacterium]